VIGRTLRLVQKTDRPARHWGSNGARAGTEIQETRRGNGEAASRGSVSVMRVEAMVMAEMVVMMPVTIVVATHPGIGIEHARIDVHGPILRDIRAVRAVGHRRRHRKHGSRKQRGGNSLQHGRIPPDIARWPVGWPGSSITALNLTAAR